MGEYKTKAAVEAMSRWGLFRGAASEFGVKARPGGQGVAGAGHFHRSRLRRAKPRRTSDCLACSWMSAGAWSAAGAAHGGAQPRPPLRCPSRLPCYLPALLPSIFLLVAGRLLDALRGSAEGVTRALCGSE